MQCCWPLDHTLRSTATGLSYREKLQVGGAVEGGNLGPWEHPGSQGTAKQRVVRSESRMEEEQEPWCIWASWGCSSWCPWGWGDILPRGDPEDTHWGPVRTGGAAGTPCWALILTRPRLLPGWWASDISVTTTDNLLSTRGLSRWMLLPPLLVPSHEAFRLLFLPTALCPTIVPHIGPSLISNASWLWPTLPLRIASLSGWPLGLMFLPTLPSSPTSGVSLLTQ